MLWTEAAFSACLAWHWLDHHWQCNWWVVWTSSRMCAGKRRTLRATIVIIFSHMTKYVSVFAKCDTIFRLFFLEITTHSNFWLSQGGKYYIDFVRNLLLFTAVKKFWKFFKNWQSYRHEFGVYYFFGTQCMSWLLFLTQATIFMLTLRPLCTIPVGDPRRELVQVVS